MSEDVSLLIYKCPICGSRDVRYGKTALSGDSGSLIDLFCNHCHTLESRRRDAKDFNAWYDHWLAPTG